MGRTSVEEFFSQKIDELSDRWNVEGGMKERDGGVLGVITNHAEIFRLRNLQTTVVVG
jgi:hypothetical protein